MATRAATETESADLERRVGHLALLLDAIRAMASERDPDALLLQIINTTSSALNVDRSTLFLLDRQRGELWSKVAQGDGIAEIRVPLGAGISTSSSGETRRAPLCKMSVEDMDFSLCVKMKKPPLGGTASMEPRREIQTETSSEVM